MPAKKTDAEKREDMKELQQYLTDKGVKHTILSYENKKTISYQCGCCNNIIPKVDWRSLSQNKGNCNNCQNRSNNLTSFVDCVEMLNKYGVTDIISTEEEYLSANISRDPNIKGGKEFLFKCKCARDECTNTFSRRRAEIKNGQIYCMEHVQINRENTNLERYDSRNVMGNPMIVERVAQTNLRVRNVRWPQEDPTVKAKTQATNMKLRNALYAMCARDVVDKNNAIKRANWLKKYNVDHWMKLPKYQEMAMKNAHKLKYYIVCDVEMRLQGYEITVVEYFLQYENITINQFINPVPTISYNLEGKHHMYHPDLYFSHLNLMVEVKSLYTYLSDYEKNTMKWFETINQGYDLQIFVVSRDEKILHIIEFKSEHCIDYNCDVIKNICKIVFSTKPHNLKIQKLNSERVCDDTPTSDFLYNKTNAYLKINTPLELNMTVEQFNSVYIGQDMIIDVVCKKCGNFYNIKHCSIYNNHDNCKNKLCQTFEYNKPEYKFEHRFIELCKMNNKTLNEIGKSLGLDTVARLSKEKLVNKIINFEFKNNNL